MSEPLSPFSGTQLSECDDLELDAWVHKLLYPDTYVRVIRLEGGGLLVDGTRAGGVEIDIPAYTQGECLNELLESELWPPWLKLWRTGVNAGPPGYKPEWCVEFYENVRKYQTPALAVCEAIIRNAWEKVNDTNT